MSITIQIKNSEVTILKSYNIKMISIKNKFFKKIILSSCI